MSTVTRKRLGDVLLVLLLIVTCGWTWNLQVTFQQQVEATRLERARADLWKNLRQSIDSGILIVNGEDGRIVEINDGACELFNWEDAEGQPLYDLLPPKLAKTHRDYITSMTTHEELTLKPRAVQCTVRDSIGRVNELQITIRGAATSPRLFFITVDKLDHEPLRVEPTIDVSMN